MVGWMDDEALHRTLTSGRVTFWSPQPAGVLAQGRHLRPRPAGSSGSRWTATATPCSCGSTRSGRPATPGPHLLRRAHAAGPRGPPDELADHRAEPTASPETTAPDSRHVRTPGRVATTGSASRSTYGQADAGRSDLRRVICAGAADVHAAGAPPARHPRRAPAAGRRRDPGRGLPQAAPRTSPAPSCWSPPSTAGCGRATRSSAPRCRATLTEQDGQAHWIGRAPGRRAHRRRPRSRPCATRSPRCAPSASPGCRR